MKIAFCGDSFCRDIDNNVHNNKPTPYSPYPYMVAEEFGAKILCSGQGGGSLYHSYETMMYYINDADYIIFCITDPFRLPNRYKANVTNSPDSWDSVLNKTTITLDGWDYNGKTEFADPDSHPFLKIKELKYPIPGKRKLKKFREGIRLYYDEVIDWKYHRVSQRGLLREMDVVIRENKKKCIYFRCFKDTFVDYIPESVVYGNMILYDDISLVEEKFMTVEEQKRCHSGDEWRPNHLSEQNNKNLANFIIDIVKEDDFTPREIDMNKYFNKDK